MGAAARFKARIACLNIWSGWEKAGKRMAAISKAAKERKMRKHIEAEERETLQASLEL